MKCKEKVIQTVQCFGKKLKKKNTTKNKQNKQKNKKQNHGKF